MALRVRRVDESVKSLVWSKKRRETAPLAICKKPRFRNVNLAGGHKFFLSRPCLSALGGRNVRHDGNGEGGAMIDRSEECRGGQERVSTVCARWAQDDRKTTT